MQQKNAELIRAMIQTPATSSIRVSPEAISQLKIKIERLLQTIVFLSNMPDFAFLVLILLHACPN